MKTMKKQTNLARVPTPIPSMSVVRLASYPRWRPNGWRKNLGAIFRVGYYSPNDGLDCIWLVNERGEYQETLDHNYLRKYFDILQISLEKNLYGRRRPPIGPTIPATKRTPASKRSR
jgi:hypothetical protein